MNSYFLYAENDIDDLALFREAIQPEGPDNTVYVTNGFALLEHLQQVKKNDSYPCLIILGFDLPRLNGIDTLYLLKTDDLYRLIPVIILSSGLSQSDEAQCKSLGADVLLRPPDSSSWPQIMDQLRGYIDD